MKYMKHLRKLALLSSLALSFSAYGDGTLPLPVVLDGTLMDMAGATEAATAAPLKVNLTRENATPTAGNIPGYGNPCSTPGLTGFRSLTGKMTVGADESTILGKCIAPTAMTGNELPFTYVAYNKDVVTYITVKSASPLTGTWSTILTDISVVDKATQAELGTYRSISLKVKAQ